MGRRTLLFVAALLVAALGTTLVFAYVRRADDRAIEHLEPIDVVVAKTLIKAGTLGSVAQRAGAFHSVRIPRSALVPGYLTETKSIENLVAVADIYPGEQLVRDEFAAVGSTGVLPIPAGKVAMSVQLGDPQRVAGFVQPGSEVAIFVTIGQPTGGTGTRLLLSRITVLAVGPTTLRPASDGGGNKEAVPTAILTLGVDQLQAQRLIFASQNGTLYFALLAKDSKVTPGPVVDTRNLFS